MEDMESKNCSYDCEIVRGKPPLSFVENLTGFCKQVRKGTVSAMEMQTFFSC